MKPKNVFKSTKKQKTLYCLNNETNSLDEVVTWLTMYFGYNIKQSVMLTYKINDDGSAPIYKGNRKELLGLAKILEEKGLETTIE